MIVEKKVRQVERIENKENAKLDLSILKKKSSAKTSSGLVLGYLKKLKNVNAPFEYLKVLESLYKEIKNLETSELIRIESWRGKGKIKVWSTPENIIVEFAGRRNKEEKPKIQTKEYTKQEVNKMIFCINKLKDEFENKIPSRDLGGEYFGGNWDSKVFCKRSDHYKFTHLLNILHHYNIIHYNRSGVTSVLREIKEIQEVLK